LKAQRRSLDLTQEALADKAACSVEMVRKVEAGTARPSRQLAELLISSVGAPPDEVPALVEWARLGRYEPRPLDTGSGDAPGSQGTALRWRNPLIAAAVAVLAGLTLIFAGAVLLNRAPATTPVVPSSGLLGAVPTDPPSVAASAYSVRDAPTPYPLEPRGLLDLGRGRYRLTAFRPSLEFTIPEDDWTLAAESTDGFELGRYRDSHAPDAAPEAYISGEQIQVVYDLPCPSAPTRTLEERPRALIDWLQDNAYISTTSPKPLSFAGFTGLEIDIAYNAPPGEECAPFETDTDRTRLHLFPLGISDYLLDPGERARVISVDVEGRPLTILTGTYNPDHYDDWQEIALPVVESITVTP